MMVVELEGDGGEKGPDHRSLTIGKMDALTSASGVRGGPIRSL